MKTQYVLVLVLILPIASLAALPIIVLDFDAFPAGPFAGGVEDGFTFSAVTNMATDNAFLGPFSGVNSLHTAAAGQNGFTLDQGGAPFQFLSLQAGGAFGGADPLTVNGFLLGVPVGSDVFAPPTDAYQFLTPVNLSGVVVDQLVFDLGTAPLGPTHIDDITLDAVPEPSAYLLLALLALLAVFYTRKKESICFAH